MLKVRRVRIVLHGGTTGEPARLARESVEAMARSWRDSASPPRRMRIEVARTSSPRLQAQIIGRTIARRAGSED